MRMSAPMIAWMATALVAAGFAAMVYLGAGATPARADAACAAACNTAHDQCMKASNDRYNCDSRRNQCLKSCGGG
jgi:hypothetical protein